MPMTSARFSIGWFAIGRSERGRPIEVVWRGRPDAPLRVLVVGGQHGDEPDAYEAVAALATASEGPPADVRLALLSCLNPDGVAAGRRENARGIDLNRDHQRLSSAEAQALHRFVRGWRPHLVVDVHTYPPRRKHLLKHGLVYCHDVLLDVATNPSRRPASNDALGRLLKTIPERLAADGYRSARYTLVNASGRVRHSTPDVVDARNGLALRYGCLSVLVEGRGPLPGDGPAERTRVRAALEATLRHLLRWVEGHRNALLLGPPPPRPGDAVVVRSRYARAEEPCTMAFRDASTGDIRRVTLPGKYTPDVRPTRRVVAPHAYAVPRSHEALLGVLGRHGFPQGPSGDGRLHRAERYHITDVRPSKRPGRPPRKIAVRAVPVDVSLDEYAVFPFTPDVGAALAVSLEPESKYGLHRFAEMELPLNPAVLYPVLRVV